MSSSAPRRPRVQRLRRLLSSSFSLFGIFRAGCHGASGRTNCTPALRPEQTLGRYSVGIVLHFFPLVWGHRASRFGVMRFSLFGQKVTGFRESGALKSTKQSRPPSRLPRRDHVPGRAGRRGYRPEAAELDNDSGGRGRGKLRGEPPPFEIGRNQNERGGHAGAPGAGRRPVNRQPRPPLG